MKLLLFLGPLLVSSLLSLNSDARFLEPDPKHQYANPYSFVGNDPINVADRSGEIGLHINGFDAEVNATEEQLYNTTKASVEASGGLHLDYRQFRETGFASLPKDKLAQVDYVGFHMHGSRFTPGGRQPAFFPSGEGLGRPYWAQQEGSYLGNTLKEAGIKPHTIENCSCYGGLMHDRFGAGLSEGSAGWLDGVKLRGGADKIAMDERGITFSLLESDAYQARLLENSQAALASRPGEWAGLTGSIKPYTAAEGHPWGLARESQEYRDFWSHGALDPRIEEQYLKVGKVGASAPKKALAPWEL